MVKKIFTILLLSAPLWGEETITDPFRLGVRHIESKGIGYNLGYSTLEAFYASTEAFGKLWIPFLDLRGHLFNNGRPAINAGVGLRYINKGRVWGVSGYYDFRKTFHARFNQAALGIESLGRVWDFRLNGYKPLGPCVKRHHSKSKADCALKSLNAEAAIHINSFKKAPLYFTAGPYYLRGSDKAIWGGEIRGMVDMYRHIRLEVRTSYDHFYRWIGQGELSVFFLIGGKKEGKKKPERYFQRVDRFEIIPITRR